jgi:hypothetical protein
MSRALVILCVIAAGAATTQQERLDAIRHAKVWSAADVRSKNLQAGPQSALAFAPGETVNCDFVDQSHGKGSTPKFHCKLASGRELKVRYGRTNGEVYAQVAATRLLWALGFPANAMYPVKVVCRGCPADPFNAKAPAAGSAPVTFDPATIDEAAPGTTIETEPDDGWAWKELDLVDERAGGATPAERDALKLLAVLIQHSSNKSINQRIVCSNPPSCSQTTMMIADVGKTFGKANLGNDDAKGAVNFKEWSGEPVWKDANSCVGNLNRTWSGSMSNPPISESGRQFLSGLLNQLSDAQLRDLFEVARFTERDPSATVAQWVEAFKHKRAEIANRKCAA